MTPFVPEPEWLKDVTDIKPAQLPPLTDWCVHPIVSMVEFEGRLFVATERQVFELIDGIWRPMVFVDRPPVPPQVA